MSQSVILFFYVQMNCARTEVHIFQLIHFARESNHVDDFIDLNELMTAKFLKQGNRFHKFKKKKKKSEVYCKHSEFLNILLA